jgi:nucleoside-diphosphate-sugar epimerase
MSSSTFAIPEHSLVLVTGANGFVGSHTAREFLKRGFRVRGTVRDLSRAAWLVNDVLKSYADIGDFELVEVKDFTAEHAFDEAVKGVSAIAHIATVTSFDPNPHNVVPQTVAGVVSLLKAALKQPEVKEFVFTSSIVAAALPAPGVVTHVDENSWNEAALELAWAPPPYTADRGMIVYMASKVEAEKALWEFGKRERPHFNLNIVSPAAILGEPLHATHIDGPAAWAKWLYEGELERLTSVASREFITKMLA